MPLKHVIAQVVVIALLCLPRVAVSPAAASSPRAQVAPTFHQVEAAYLFNFARFTRWPPSKFAGPASPVVIGILGPDPFGSDLDRALSTRQVQGRPVAVRRYREVKDIGDCHILFTTLRDRATLDGAFRKVRGAGVLTVGEGADFARAGGVMAFVLHGEMVRFVVNADAQARAGVTLSSQLLKLATVIRD